MLEISIETTHLIFLFFFSFFQSFAFLLIFLSFSAFFFFTFYGTLAPFVEVSNVKPGKKTIFLKNGETVIIAIVQVENLEFF